MGLNASHDVVPAGTIPVSVRREAAAWLVELQSGSPDDATLAAWRTWLAAHADHQRAWRRIEQFEDKLQGLSSPLAHAALTAPPAPPRRRALQKLAVVLVAGGSVWALRDEAAWRSWTATHRTAVAERSRITLADGSQIDLNADTAVDVLFTDTQRLLRLHRGEIGIVTAADPQALQGGPVRPFVVQTAQGRARAIGTRYTVGVLEGDRADHSLIAVQDGAVELSLRNGQVRRLGKGEQAEFGHDHIGESEPVADGADAWRDGMIVAHEMPLVEFIARLGRYRSGRLACDPAVADLKVTGTYPLADTDRVLDVLRATLPVELRTFSRYWVTVVPAARP